MEGRTKRLHQGALPQIGEDVIVHGDTYRCLGYYGDDREWHSSFSGKPLKLVRGWSRLSDNEITLCQPS